MASVVQDASANQKAGAVDALYDALNEHEDDMKVGRLSLFWWTILNGILKLQKSFSFLNVVDLSWTFSLTITARLCECVEEVLKIRALTV